jgi:hypothetical protein
MELRWYLGRRREVPSNRPWTLRNTLRRSSSFSTAQRIPCAILSARLIFSCTRRKKSSLAKLLNQPSTTTSLAKGLTNFIPRKRQVRQTALLWRAISTLFWQISKGRKLNWRNRLNSVIRKCSCTNCWLWTPKRLKTFQVGKMCTCLLTCSISRKHKVENSSRSE